jgi:hypothetical protein
LGKKKELNGIQECWNVKHSPTFNILDDLENTLHSLSNVVSSTLTFYRGRTSLGASSLPRDGVKTMFVGSRKERGIAQSIKHRAGGGVCCVLVFLVFLGFLWFLWFLWFL